MKKKRVQGLCGKILKEYGGSGILKQKAAELVIFSRGGGGYPWCVN